MRCPTVQIQMEPSESNPTGMIIINESDYDPETMTLFSVGVEVAPSKPVEPVKNPVQSIVHPQVSGGVATPPWSK